MWASIDDHRVPWWLKVVMDKQISYMTLIGVHSTMHLVYLVATVCMHVEQNKMSAFYYTHRAGSKFDCCFCECNVHHPSVGVSTLQGQQRHAVQGRVSCAVWVTHRECHCHWPNADNVYSGRPRSRDQLSAPSHTCQYNRGWSTSEHQCKNRWCMNISVCQDLI